MFTEIIHTCYLFVYWHLLRPGFKYFTHLITGKCELQRIMECCNHFDGRTLQLEYSLVNSKHPVLRHSLLWKAGHEEAVNKYNLSIMQIKRMQDNEQFQYSTILLSVLTQIHAYQRLISQVESKRHTSYSSENPLHEEMLIKLWETLCPNEPLESRVSRQWSDIGFQGDDPKTDFRGMGILGLINLLYFGETYPDQCQQALLNSQHPEFGYSFAIVGINLTALIHSLLERGQLKRLYYIRIPGSTVLNHFNETYCYIFREFNSYWMERKPNIMQFNEVRREFKQDLLKQLDSNALILNWNLTTEFN